MTALQEQISEARKYFNLAEKTADPIAKKALVETALELFEDCIESQPTEKEELLIKNVKNAFTRTLVNQISNMNFNNYGTLEFFISVLCLKFCPETVELMKSDSEFNRKFEWIKEQYSEEITRALR